MNFNILLTITILIIILVIIYHFSYNNQENWVDYQLNYGQVKSGSDPLYFYRRDIYRKPYRWPFTFYKSYPVPHQSPIQN